MNGVHITGHLGSPGSLTGAACRRRLRRHRYHRRNGLVSHYFDRVGKRRFKGLAKLKKSQAYPITFARAVTQPMSLGGATTRIFDWDPVEYLKMMLEQPNYRYYCDRLSGFLGSHYKVVKRVVNSVSLSKPIGERCSSFLYEGYP